MIRKNSSFQNTIDILVGVIPTIVLYGNFIMIGLIFGIKDMIRFNNPIDQVFIISLGSLLGFSGLLFSFGRYSNRLSLVINSILLITGIITVVYVIISLYSEQDSPDSLLEKIYIAPLFASLIVGFKRLYLNIWK
ncbi:MAG: hypothetical protein ACR2NW_07465 [Thermodesulfobacteriota bacterium]